MAKFKVGDTVRFVDGHVFTCGSRTARIRKIEGKLYKFEHGTTLGIVDAEYKGEYQLQLVKANLVPHVHHDVIIAWAKGETIQCKTNTSPWRDVPDNQPHFIDHQHYRVKPEKSEAELRKEEILMQIEKLQDEIKSLEVK